MLETKFYCYIYYRQNDTPFYIGKGNKNVDAA